MSSFVLQKPEGFLLVIDEFGKVIYVSESILMHLGFSYVSAGKIRYDEFGQRAAST